jgi:DNA-binding ferritin-like protein (Dps family)
VAVRRRRDHEEESMTVPPGEEHDVPDGVSDGTVLALGKLSEALETTERARGALYDFHQLTGHADLMLDEAIELLEAAGHRDEADAVRTRLVGRDVAAGRWSFQLVEDYDDHYMALFREVERGARDRLAQGRRHLHEAALKRGRGRGETGQRS